MSVTSDDTSQALNFVDSSTGDVIKTEVNVSYGDNINLTLTAITDPTQTDDLTQQIAASIGSEDVIVDVQIWDIDTNNFLFDPGESIELSFLSVIRPIRLRMCNCGICPIADHGKS